jgi:hypothetical protein
LNVRSINDAKRPLVTLFGDTLGGGDNRRLSYLDFSTLVEKVLTRGIGGMPAHSTNEINAA